jgi:hypothetical protein
LALPIFVITIFVSAFLLFLVQPIVGKLILPKLGGTPQVWNTCMVFFQSALLLGYAYTHTVSTRLKLRQQLVLHCCLLALPVLIMFMFPMYTRVQDWSPPSGSNPIVDTLILLAIIVGVPFFVVSTSAPLLQKWFAYSGHPQARDPYFLYAASNLGSLLSLYFYPLVIEPNTVLAFQSQIWFFGYLILAACVLYGAYTIFKLAPPDSVLAAEAAAEAAATAPAPVTETSEAIAPAPAPVPAAESATAVKSGPAPRSIQRKKGMKLAGGAADEPHANVAREPVVDNLYGANAPMTTWRRIRWVLLAMVPSSLMLGVTSYVSTDLSPFPLVWIIPLSLYLLSFILVYLKFWTGNPIFKFGSGYTMHDATIFVLQPVGILILAFIVLTHRFDPIYATGLTMLGFFANALACHGELAKDRPSTKHLTEYFLLMSVGGMLGGVFNGILAPMLFQTSVLEFNIAICLACFVRPLYMLSGWFEEMLYSLAPGFRAWVVGQGDEMAKSMGKPAPNSTYLFSYFLDVAFALLLLVAVYFLSDTLNYGTQDGRKNLIAVMKYLPVPKTQGGMQIAFNILVFFIPMVFCFFFAGRPLRMGLALVALLVGHLYMAENDDRRFVDARRTYFGLLRVQKSVEEPQDEEERRNFRNALAVNKKGEPMGAAYPFTFLMHGTTYHGRNYLPPSKEDPGRVDLTRLATTYYHRYGPVGIVMERYNWFKGAQNTFRADVRMPAAMVSQIAASIGTSHLPMSALVETWSEPPFATIGLGTGTMISYARPYQHMTYYEIDDVIREFSIPESGDGHFTYIQNAIRRGVNAEVIMGDARQSLGREKDNYNNSFIYSFDFLKRKFEPPVRNNDEMFRHREGYYKVINVDAFSSDAIPIHLCTKQAIQLYLNKMTDDGVLMVHTSNRHMDLVIPVARIVLELSKESVKKAEEAVETMSPERLREIYVRTNPKEAEKFDIKNADNLKKAKEVYVKSQEIHCRVGKDRADREKYMGHFSSEYVMVYRGAASIDKAEREKRGDGVFADYVEDLSTKKTELINGNQMKAEGGAPDGYQILNADIEWYDPTVRHIRSRGSRGLDKAITEKDALWTDDYSYILGVLRLPW